VKEPFTLINEHSVPGGLILRKLITLGLHYKRQRNSNYTYQLTAISSYTVTDEAGFVGVCGWGFVVSNNFSLMVQK